jgi:hypothetical protein
MKPSTETMLSFYQQLGRVFYGVAAADGTVRKGEAEKLKKIIKTEWVPAEDTSDEFETDSAYQIEIVFDWLNENDWNKESILADFSDFREEHPGLFSAKNRQLIMETAETIADAFHNINKKEIRFLTELGQALA